MSVAWFSELYRLNEAGRFADALGRSDKYLGQRPRDYALHLQRARALVGLGQLEDAEVHLDAAVTHSQGLAAWPFFYRATLHALAGRSTRARADLERAVTLDPSLVEVAAKHEVLGRFKVKGARSLEAATTKRVGSAKTRGITRAARKPKPATKPTSATKTKPARKLRKG